VVLRAMTGRSTKFVKWKLFGQHFKADYYASNTGGLPHIASIRDFRPSSALPAEAVAPESDSLGPDPAFDHD